MKYTKTPAAQAASATLDTSTDTPSAGGNADLDALQSLANQVDGETADPLDSQAGEGEAAPVNYGNEAAKMVDTFSALAVGYCPPTAAVWDAGKKGAVTAALAPVLEKYGMTMAALPCEAVLILVAGPALYQTAKIIALQMKAEQNAKAVEKAAAPRVEAKTGETGQAPAPETHPQTALYK